MHWDQGAFEEDFSGLTVQATALSVPDQGLGFQLWMKCFNFPFQSYILLYFQPQLCLIVLQEAEERLVSTFDLVEQLGSCMFVSLSLHPGCSMDETQVPAPAADIL